MKPISLHGHERSVTQIIYNREGDLLFSAAKDHNPNVWYSINGERLGTYDGHGKNYAKTVQLNLVCISFFIICLITVDNTAMILEIWLLYLNTLFL